MSLKSVGQTLFGQKYDKLTTILSLIILMTRIGPKKEEMKNDGDVKDFHWSKNICHGVLLAL